MRNWADLEFGLTGGSLWQPHYPQDEPATPGGFGIDPRLDAAALRAPAASREDSRPQAILKLQRPSSFDYRARHGPPVNNWHCTLCLLFCFCCFDTVPLCLKDFFFLRWKIYIRQTYFEKIWRARYLVKILTKYHKLAFETTLIIVESFQSAQWTKHWLK